MTKARASSTTVAPALAPLLVGAWNPLDLNGPQFLAFYIPACLLTVGAACWMRSQLRLPDDCRETPELTPSEIACLDRGPDGALQTTLATLFVDGRIRLRRDASFITKWTGIGTRRRLCSEPRQDEAIASQTPDDLEIALLNCTAGRHGALPQQLLKEGRPAATRIAQRLKDRGLMESSASLGAARWWPAATVAAMGGLGLAKLFVGVSRGRPIGFLAIILFAMAFVGVVLLSPPRRTRTGERILRDLKQRHQALRALTRKKGPDAIAELPAAELALAAGLFGQGAFDHPDLRWLDRSLRHAACGDGGGGGCGGGCGGCGG